MFCKKKSRLQQAQKLAEAKAHQISARAGDTLHTAQDTFQSVLGEVREHTPERLDDLKSTASDALHTASEVLHGAASRVADVAQGAVSTLGSRADTLKSKADALREQAESAKDSALKSAREMKQQREKQAREAAEAAQREADRMQKQARKQAKKRGEEFVVAHAPEFSVESSNQKWLWLLVGVGIGTLAGVLLAPNTGRRTRAALKDKLGRGPGAVSDLGESVSRKAHDLSNRAQGALHEFSAKHSGQGTDETADDVTIADRVRSELGRLEQEHSLERINVDSCDGIVTLRGPAKEQSIADALVSEAQKVAGVREVKNELNVEGSGESFVG
jgi:osmotically-inducible protein OsmY